MFEETFPLNLVPRNDYTYGSSEITTQMLCANVEV